MGQRYRNIRNTLTYRPGDGIAAFLSPMNDRYWRKADIRLRPLVARNGHRSTSSNILSVRWERRQVHKCPIKVPPKKGAGVDRKSELAVSYRLRASRLRNEAKIATAHDERDALLELAYHWELLADEAERDEIGVSHVRFWRGTEIAAHVTEGQGRLQGIHVCTCQTSGGRDPHDRSADNSSVCNDTSHLAERSQFAPALLRSNQVSASSRRSLCWPSIPCSCGGEQEKCDY